MEPFFSVIIPTYNRADLIGIAIESVLKQSYGSWELLIVDDGSTDNTKEVVTTYTDQRIKYIHQKNAERSAARNNGIKQSKGSYICFLDSDDYYLPQRLQLLYNSLQQLNFPQAAFYTGLVLDIDGVLAERPENKTTGQVFDDIALSVIHSQQVCIHKSILTEFNYDTNFHIGEDMELWLRIAAKYPFQYLENQFTVVVVEHNNRSINVKRFNTYPDRLRMLRRVFSNNHPGKNISPVIKKELISSCYFGIAKYFIYNGKRPAAVKNLLLAIASDPSNFQNKYRLNIIFKLLLPKGIEKARILL